MPYRQRVVEAASVGARREALDQFGGWAHRNAYVVHVRLVESRGLDDESAFFPMTDGVAERRPRRLRA